MKKVTVKELQHSIDYYNAKKGRFRRYFPWFANWWPKVSFGMSRLIQFTQKLEVRLNHNVDLLSTPFSTELYQIINTLSERDQRNLTGGIFAPISRLINTPSLVLLGKKIPEIDDKSSQPTTDKPADPEPEEKSINDETPKVEESAATVDLAAKDISTDSTSPVINAVPPVDTSDEKPTPTPPASTPTILQIMQTSAPLEKHHSPLTETGSAPTIARPHLQHSHSQPGGEVKLHPHSKHRHKKPVTKVSVGTSTQDLEPIVVRVVQAPQRQLQPNYVDRVSRAGIFGMAMGYVGMIDALEEGNTLGAFTYGGLTSLIYAAVAYQSGNNTSVIGMASVLLSIITFNWWPPRMVAHALAAVGVSAAVNFRMR